MPILHQGKNDALKIWITSLNYIASKWQIISSRVYAVNSKINQYVMMLLKKANADYYQHQEYFNLKNKVIGLLTYAHGRILQRS